MFMATKTITVKKSAYDALAMEKRPNESFSDVVLRVTKKAPLTDCFGAWKMTDEEWKEIKKKLDERWLDFEKDMRRGLGE